MKPKKILYKIIYPFAELYWFIFKPKTYGVRCLIEYNKKFLLIKHSYANYGWTISGGGVHRNETPEEAIKREIKEELGIILDDIKKIGEYESIKEYKRDTVYCFYSKVSDPDFTIDKNEVSEAQWFSLKEIPEPHSSAVDKILKMKGMPG